MHGNPADPMNPGSRKPLLNRRRIWLAFGTAIAADIIQVSLGPLGFSFADELLDVAVMIALVRLIGFHPLLLPTFLIELVPVVDLAPTWTACVAVVIALRLKEHRAANPPAATEQPSDVIDV